MERSTLPQTNMGAFQRAYVDFYPVTSGQCRIHFSFGEVLWVREFAVVSCRMPGERRIRSSRQREGKGLCCFACHE